jgi:hypothetical protein
VADELVKIDNQVQWLLAFWQSTFLTASEHQLELLIIIICIIFIPSFAISIG